MHEERREPHEASAPPERRLDREDRSVALKIGLLLLVVVLFVLFIIQNSNPVVVDFVFFQSRIRLVWVFLACALIGMLLAWLAGRTRRRAQKRLIEELERFRKEHD